ncbi:MAG: NADH-quinone oxidoreductase subunit L, partial [Ignavibacteriae bacterium]|nr:NADH-quinone oxidoreductase subunit L [Ignavibacteriota bacterium]
MIVNRIGDAGLALAMFVCFYVFKTVDFGTIFALAPYYVNYNIVFINLEINALGLITILILIGAVGKSAQIGL